MHFVCHDCWLFILLYSCGIHDHPCVWSTLTTNSRGFLHDFAESPALWFEPALRSVFWNFKRRSSLSLKGACIPLSFLWYCSWYESTWWQSHCFSSMLLILRSLQYSMLNVTWLLGVFIDIGNIMYNSHFKFWCAECFHARYDQAMALLFC